MNISQLRYVQCVAQKKNISTAADSLYITQQAMSKSIASLEKEWNVKLFTRTNTGTELTHIGKQLMPAIDSMIRKYDESERIIQCILDQNAVAIHMAVENELFLKRLPYELISTVGDIKITPYYINDIGRCIEDVLLRRADLALVTNPPEDIAEQKLHFVEIYHCTPSVVFQKGHPLGRKQVLELSDLKNEGQIGISRDASFIRELIAACINKGFYPRYHATYPDAIMVMNAVAQSRNIVVIGSDEILTNPGDCLEARPLVDAPQFRLGFLLEKTRVDEPAIRSYLAAVKASM